jgi:methionine synthase I (cobalamin-dependent)/5,10-methylenetetrahydrofolate reductase
MKNSLFSNGILVFDGAIGTELYGRGFYINRPFEELNLTAAADVIAVHKSYIDAGAKVITTNTFSIPSFQLKKFDIEKQQQALLEAALKNANEARKQSQAEGIKIAVSIGPTGQLMEPLGPMSRSEVFEEYQKIAQNTLNTGVPFDFFILETFSNVDELEEAFLGLQSTCKDKGIIASISVSSSGMDSLLSLFAQRFSGKDVLALGLNCSEGPSQLFTAVKKLVPLTEHPVLVQPNAGIPQQINGRYFYMTSPDYLAKFAKRYVESGALGVGGCCGTGPEHILAISQAVKMANAQKKATLSFTEQFEKEDTHARFEYEKLEDRKSFVAESFKSGKKFFSIEVNPPKGCQLDAFFEQLMPIQKAGVHFVNIPDSPRATTRVSSLHAAISVQNQQKLGLHVLPHLTTRDRNLIALQADLLGAHANGVRDVLIVTGDPPKLGNNKDATGVYDVDSIGLTYLVNCLNHGQSPSGESLGSRTQFGIGVASNPTALNLELELRRWQFKVESGADFAVTQPIFDGDNYHRWLEKISKHHRPHMIGIWPLVSLRNAEFLANEVPGVYVPKWVLEEMAKAGDNKEEAIKRGLEIAEKVMRNVWDSCAGFCVSAPLGKIPIGIDLIRRF